MDRPPRIWLDSAASTPLDPEIAEAMTPWIRPGAGANPSSLHAEGRAVRRAIEDVRDEIASHFSVSQDRVHFTGSATEANNLAIAGALRALPADRRPLRVIASAMEHDSVRNCLVALEREGTANVSWIPSTADGQVDLQTAEQVCGPSIALAALMHVNNETGVIQPIQEWRDRIRRDAPGAVLVCDAVQAMPRIPLCLGAVDLITISAHKMHGPPGVGALIRLRPISIRPLVFGGPQEGGLRAGTESVAAIVGLGAALRLAVERRDRAAARLRELSRCFLETLQERGCDFAETSPEPIRAPGMLSLVFPQIEANDLVIAADLEGIALSAGSACHSGTPEPSHVLRAMGLSDSAARHTVRVVFHRNQTPDQAREAAGRLASAIARTHL